MPASFINNGDGTITIKYEYTADSQKVQDTIINAAAYEYLVGDDRIPWVLDGEGERVPYDDLSNQQKLNLELPSLPGKIRADSDRLMQVLLNLLTNASNFSGPHKEIFLRAYPVNGELVIEVQDGAPPIPPQEAELIFNPYHRSKRKGSVGLGLGLFICKKLVTLHGGRIWVETDSNGNRFKFSLPIANNTRGET